MKSFRRLGQLMLERKTLTMVPTESTEDGTPPTSMVPMSTEEGTRPKKQTKEKKTWTHAYEKYGLPSPPRGEHPCDPADAIAAMTNDGFGKYRKSKKLMTDKGKVLFFLYGRGFLCREEKRKRVQKIKKIIKRPEALKRAVSLVTKGGDKDVTKKYTKQYLALGHRLEAYFKQPGAFGLRPPTEGAN